MKQSTWWMIGGVVSLIGGIIALAYPVPASVFAVLLAAWAFVISGIFTLIASFRATEGGQRIWGILWSILSVVLGIFMIANPLAGLISLTFAIGGMFLIGGIFRIAFGFRTRGKRHGWLSILSGAISIFLGFVLLKYLPIMSTVALGTFLGIDLLCNGIALVAIAMGARSLSREFGRV